jgi:predicted Fe-S protein YdhL (DUF1289 family)
MVRAGDRGVQRVCNAPGSDHFRPMERPCIKICRYEDHTGWCFGCGMTKPEKKSWKKAPEYRSAILANLEPRLVALAAAGHATGAAAGKKKATP